MKGGLLPPELCYLTALTSLTIQGATGEIPPELGSLVNLRELDLYEENHLCGGRYRRNWAILPTCKSWTSAVTS